MNMSDKEVKGMLQKYMDGMTSVEEEAQLATYFRKAGGKAAPEGIAEEDWQAYKQMFAMFAPKRRMGALWRYAAAVLLLVVAGSGVWLRRSMLNDDHIAMAATADSASIEVMADTFTIKATPQKKTPAAKKQQSGKPKRLRHEPAVPRHYMAQAAEPEVVDPEEALRQADLLMQAVYLQQQSDLTNAMIQCTLVIEEEEETY